MPASSVNINDSFFHSSYKQAWRKIIPPGLTEAEADFIIDVCGLREKAEVADLMCGYGRHAIELGRRGLQVTAIDNLPDYIEEINATAQQDGLPVRGQCVHVLDAPLDTLYDAMICMGNSFAFFNREDAVLLLKKIRKNLKEEGTCIINSWMIAEIAIKYFREHDWHYAGDYKCILDYRYKFNPSRIESVQTIVSPDGSVEDIRGVDYIFSLNEISSMCAEAGLELVEMYSTPRKKPFVLGDGKIYMVIRPLRPKS